MSSLCLHELETHEMICSLSHSKFQNRLNEMKLLGFTLDWKLTLRSPISIVSVLDSPWLSTFCKDWSQCYLFNIFRLNFAIFHSHVSYGWQSGFSTFLCSLKDPFTEFPARVIIPPITPEVYVTLTSSTAGLARRMTVSQIWPSGYTILCPSSWKGSSPQNVRAVSVSGSWTGPPTHWMRFGRVTKHTVTVYIFVNFLLIVVL